MKPGLISIYVPTKNRRALLSSAVDSVLEQTYRNFELIIVNDGSTDDTRSYLDALTAREPRVRALHNERSRGAPCARNWAIQAAGGEFVTGLDDDDRFHPERLAACIEFWHSLAASGRPFSAIYTQDIIVNGAERSTTRKPDQVTADQLFFHNQIGNQIFTLREYFLRAGAFDEKMPAWQDLDAFMRVLRHFGRAVLLDRALYYLDVDQRPDRISLGGQSKLRDAYRRIIAKSPDAPSALKQALFLQRFGALYRHSPGVSDLGEFFSYGIHPRNIKRLVGVYARRMTGIW